MKATLALLLSLCLVLVDVSFGDESGNTDTPVALKARDTYSGKKCERMFPKPPFAGVYCEYRCRTIEKKYGEEADGTLCWFDGLWGRCKEGFCFTKSGKFLVEPTEEESPELTEQSAEPAEETPVPTEETPDTVD